MKAALGAAAVMALFGAADASAALPFAYGPKCGASNFECARLTVPLDRTGAVPGKVRLYVERARGAGRRSGAVFALAGGPGQGATTLTESFNRDLSGRVGRRDMIVFDQRGTGKSGALGCRALELPDDRPIDVRTAECAAQLGARRSLYTTRDSVEDLEAVRAALDIDKISLVGVSYGTKVALAYAMAYPRHVERLVLDSVVDPAREDPFALDGLAALSRVFAEVCREQCARITTDLAADVAGVVQAMPLRGRFVNSRGKARTETIDARALYGIIRAADLDPNQRAEYPAAVRAAALGDPAPLLRLEHRYDDLVFDEPDEVAEEQIQSLSFSLQAATLCEEGGLPWSRTATPEERDAQAAQAAAAIPDAAFAPFTRASMLVADSNNLLFQCRRWPMSATAPALVDRGLPDVPVLVFEGLEDTRTPLEVGLRVAERFPRAEVVNAPKTAHAVLGRAPCARVALERFFAKAAVGAPCEGKGKGGALLPLAPSSLEGLSPRRAVRLTLADLAREKAARIFPPVRGGGLRSGWFIEHEGTVELRDYSYVPGVRITGTLASSLKRGSLSVSGEVTGNLRVRKGRLVGTLRR